MTRSLYRSILWLHPPGFRRQFAPEMLWIFDEAAPSQGPGRLILDGIASLLRQWVIGCGAWKILAGAIGATAQILMVTPLATLVRVPQHATHNLPLPTSLSDYDLAFSRGLALLVVVLVLGLGARAFVSPGRPRS